MEEKMFVKNWTEQPGQQLYQSLWKSQSSESPKTVVIFQRMIQYNDSVLPFCFDLRFMVAPNKITFYQHDQEITFELPNADHKLWRDFLKSYISQVGFHQQYKPIKKIGKGNFASVYLVEGLQDKNKYAVKAFSKEAAYSEENGKECLMKEIEIMRHLNNPHNMKLCEVFQSENSLYIIFELLDGGQLFEKIKAKEKFKPDQVQKMVRGILEGLKELHSKNIMHRDLKPENLLFRSKDSFDCVIADYGLAQFSDADEYLFVRCGTPGYVAPEVINIKDMKTKYQPICDIFSLGLIFHLLLFGKSVFKGKSYNDVLKENKACAFSLDGQEYQKADKIAMDLLKKMLKINPEERITAQAALSHPYFREESVEKEKEEAQEEEVLLQSKDQVEVGESPILTTSNEMRKQKASLITSDSLGKFKMGNVPVLTGKTETVGQMGSGKISGFGANLLKGFRPSKFVRPAQSANKEN